MKKNALFDLIHSLSRAEKRYFKLYVSGRKKDNKYIGLFDCIVKMENPDEKQMKLSAKSTSDQFHVAKNYLYHLILKSLRNFHHKSSVDIELHALLQDCEVLYNRELYNQCLFFVQKGLRIANRFERFSQKVILLDWQRKLLRILHPQDLKSVDDTAQENHQCLVQLTIEHELRKLSNRLIAAINQPVQDVILNHPFIQKADQTVSLEAKVLYSHIRYVHALIREKDDMKAIGFLENLTDELEQQPHRIKDKPDAYITVLNNSIGWCLHKKNYHLIPGFIDKIRAIPKVYQTSVYQKNLIKALVKTYNVELELYRDTNQPEKGIALAVEVKSFLEEHPKSIPEEYIVLLHYQLAHMYFQLKRQDDALDWLNGIVLTSYTKRLDIQSFARLLFLMIHFELNNILIIKYAVDSTRRFLKKKRQIQPYEMTLLRFFSKISTSPKKSYRHLFETLKEELTFGEQRHNTLDYLNFELWIEQQLT